MITHVVIPVRDQLHLTRYICEQLKEQPGWDKCWIYDNGSVDGTAEYLMEIFLDDPRFQPVEATGFGIYEMWDHGFSQAKMDGADFVAFLNNDIRLFENTFDRLNEILNSDEKAWIVYPDYNSTMKTSPSGWRETKGTYRHGGMSGFCFMLRADKIDWSPLVDPIFKWWGGDDDIAFNVEKRGGRQIRVLGLPVAHMNEGTARHHNLGAQKAADLQAVLKKWGR